MSDFVRPHRRQPTRLPRPWDSPGKNTEVGCHFLLQCMKVKGESEVAQLRLTLSDPMDCSLPGSSIHGIFQARVMEWGAIAFSLAIWNLRQKSIMKQKRQFCTDKSYNPQQRQNNNLNASFITDIVKKKKEVKWIVGKYCGRFYNVFHILLQIG